jgi:hypothetical protein
MTTRNIIFRIIAGLLLIAALAGIGFFAYQAGVTHAAAANVQLPAVETAVAPYPHFMHPFFGFGCFIPLVILFLVCLAFGSMRRMVWGPRWGWRRMHGPMHGPMGSEDCKGRGPWGEGVPPFFAEWHRRAHGETDKTPGENQK